jgi:hypothetical protein
MEFSLLAFKELIQLELDGVLINLRRHVPG